MARLLDLKRFVTQNRLLTVVLFFCALAVFANTFGNQMFWDDEDFILNNVFVQNLALDKFFTENIIAGAGLVSNYYRPVLAIVFSLQYQVWQESPAGYHVVNTAFHIAAGITLFYLLKGVFKNKKLAFFTSLIFLIHPLQTEAVAYVSSLGDSLSVFFIFLGLLAYHKGRIKTSLFLYALALLSKETAVVMPGLIYLLEWYKSDWKRAIKKTWAFFVLGLGYVLLRATALNFENTFNLYDEANVFTESVFVRTFTFLRILLVYLSLLFWPRNLHMERAVDFVTGFAIDALFGFIALALLLTTAYYFRKSHPIVSFGILWFFISLSITSNIVVPINGLLYEHWLYLPLVGLFLSVIYLFLYLTNKYKLQQFAIVFLILIMIFAGARAIARNREWKDPITFYNQTLAHSPDSYRVTNNLAKAYAERGDFESAERVYLRAIELNEESPVAYHNLANAYKATGRIAEAVVFYKKALQRDQEFVFSYSALVNLYLEEKMYQEARELLSQSLEASDQKLELYLLLYQVAEAQNDFESALQYLEQALLIDPGNRVIQDFYIKTKSKT